VFLVADTRRIAARLARLSAPPRAEPKSEYHFLLGRFVDKPTLARADSLAARWGIHPHEVMIANGWIDAEDYYCALAAHCWIPFKTALSAGLVEPAGKMSPRQCLASGLLKDRTRAQSYVLAPARLRPNALREMLARLSPYSFALASSGTVRAAICHHFQSRFARSAVQALVSRYPDKSAKSDNAFWQGVAFVFLLEAILCALVFAPLETIWVVTFTLAVLFLPLIAFRFVAAWGLLRAPALRERTATPRVEDHELPIYTILVPLYREAHMLPGLIKALTRVDWPAAKLDIKLILEAADPGTIEAARALRLPGNIEIIVVPDIAPRTKPKALNYALPLARGEFVVIYDAEEGLSATSFAARFMPSAQGRPTSPRCRRNSTSTTRETIG
jgi:glycosyltransferase XagB